MGKVTGIGEDRYHFLQYKITDGNSDTTETSEDPVVPLFPQPRIPEVIIRKNAESGPE